MRSSSVAGSSSSASAVPAYYGSNICILGDSIANQNSNVVSGSYNYLGRGEVTQMSNYLGWPWEWQPSDNFAVAGTTLDAMIATQLPLLLAAHATRRYTRCFISAGTNDTNTGSFTIAQVKANYMKLYTALRAVGIIPVFMGIRPRGADVSMTTPKLQNLTLNEWNFQLGMTGMIEYIPISEVYADNSTAFGNCLAALMYDSVLHPNYRGANLAGKAMADWYAARGIVPQMRFATQQSDKFDRTNNITGIAFNLPNPLLQGGTTAPTGMTTSGGTWSKVNRTLSNGQTRSDCSCILAAPASAVTHYLYDDWVTSGIAWGATQPQPGDYFEMRSKVAIPDGVGIQAIQIRASVSDGVTTTSHYGNFTDGSSMVDGAHTLYLKTPEFVIPAYAGSGNMSLYTQIQIIANTLGTGTPVVSACDMRYKR